MFLLVGSLIWASVLAHVALRTLGLLGVRGWRRVALAALVFLLGFAYVPARVLIAFGAAERFATGLSCVSAWFLGLVCLLWTLLVLFEVGAAVVWLAARRRVRDAPPPARRAIGTTLLGATAALAAAGWLIAHSSPGVTTLRVTAPGAEARRFAVICDSHLGSISSERQWRRTLETARALEPDALLIPGDLIDDHTARTEPQAAVLREVFPRLPAYATTGNHDFYAGLARTEELFERLDVRLLRQEVVPLSPGVSVGGIDDSHLAEPQEAARAILAKGPGPLLLLSHRPAAAELLRDRPETLVLAGHTHGGQIPPMVFLVGLGNGGFRAGHYRVGRAHLYVSRGSGPWGPPMRLLAPPEIVLLEIETGPEFAVRVEPL
jgi:predicted MPP superfamily phosphohydrolase